MGIRIELPQDAWAQVVEQADREWRTPKQQAEYLILRALGWELPPLPVDQTDQRAPSAGAPPPSKPPRQPAQERSGAS